MCIRFLSHPILTRLITTMFCCAFKWHLRPTLCEHLPKSVLGPRLSRSYEVVVLLPFTGAVGAHGQQHADIVSYWSIAAKKSKSILSNKKTIDHNNSCSLLFSAKHDRKYIGHVFWRGPISWRSGALEFLNVLGRAAELHDLEVDIEHISDLLQDFLSLCRPVAFSAGLLTTLGGC